MASNVRILPINTCVSDGHSSRWPSASKGLTRNDQHFLDRLANERWGPETIGRAPPGVTYRLDRLPDGYAGFERGRPETKHIDRYIYGHPTGIFRSIPDFYPHFKHLMDHGISAGCTCKICSGNARRPSSVSGSNGGGRTIRNNAVSPLRSKYFNQPIPADANRAPSRHQSHFRGNAEAERLPQGRLPPSPSRDWRRKQVDEDGTLDIYRALLDRLKQADGAEIIDEIIQEHSSPDWRVGHASLGDSLQDMRKLPHFVPRCGEIVLLVRALSADEQLSWDSKSQTWQRLKTSSNSLLGPAEWEAGVVTQMPVESVSEKHINNDERQSSVTYSGFRVEPLSRPGSTVKTFSKQHKYVPLRAIRPFYYWKDCLAGVNEADWHPTIRHALTISNSFCVVSPIRFTGSHDEHTGRNATINCRGIYLGSELVLIGDVVRLLPNPQLQEPAAVTDVMVVTRIKLRLVNLDEAGDDDWNDGRPYNVCLHVSGKIFTLDPARSFDGIGKSVVDARSATLPQGYGQWYHVTDPHKKRARLEMPFTRIGGRCYESVAMDEWYRHPQYPDDHGILRKRSQADRDISHGLTGLLEARTYSSACDDRIDKQAGKSWYWADTRVEQLDLHQVNGYFVGIKDNTRTKAQMNEWRKALKVQDGRKGGLEEFQAARKESKEHTLSKFSTSYGMLATTLSTSTDSPLEGGSESEEDEEPDQGEQQNIDDDEDKEEEKEEDSDVIMADHDEGTMQAPHIVAGSVVARKNTTKAPAIEATENTRNDVAGSLPGHVLSSTIDLTISDDE